MRGLIKATIVIALIILVGTVASVILTIDLGNKISVAREGGYEAGHEEGFVEGFQDGTVSGYQKGSRAGYAFATGVGISDNLAGFYFSYDPYYDELKDILTEAGSGSAKEIHDYAEANGIRAAYVRCQIAREARPGRVYLYELVGFETVDRGLVIVEPSTQREVAVEVGQSYRELNGRPLKDYDDTITKITIVW
jgi:voltage-gated potassium channel Kch